MELLNLMILISLVTCQLLPLPKKTTICMNQVRIKDQLVRLNVSQDLERKNTNMDFKTLSLNTRGLTQPFRDYLFHNLLLMLIFFVFKKYKFLIRPFSALSLKNGEDHVLIIIIIIHLI